MRLSAPWNRVESSRPEPTFDLGESPQGDSPSAELSWALPSLFSGWWRPLLLLDGGVLLFSSLLLLYGSRLLRLSLYPTLLCLSLTTFTTLGLCALFWLWGRWLDSRLPLLSPDCWHPGDLLCPLLLWGSLALVSLGTKGMWWGLVLASVLPAASVALGGRYLLYQHRLQLQLQGRQLLPVSLSAPPSQLQSLRRLLLQQPQWGFLPLPDPLPAANQPANLLQALPQQLPEKPPTDEDSPLPSSLPVRHLMLLDPGLSKDQLLDLIDQLGQRGLWLHVFSEHLRPLALWQQGPVLSGLPLCSFAVPRPSPTKDRLKRLLDGGGALVGVLFLLPLWLVLPLLIRWGSPGSPLFAQRRIGRKQRPFFLWKFRTMWVETDPYQPAPQHRDDRRLTPLGRWLRRTSLDELPQLFNTLRGEMSLVGPRPEMPFWVASFPPWSQQRFEVSPGLTGLWQIAGRADLCLQEHLEYDLYYVRNRSLLLDLQILLRSFRAIYKGTGAY